MEFLSLHEGDVLLVGGEVRLSVSVLQGVASIAISHASQVQCFDEHEQLVGEVTVTPCLIMLSPKEPPS